jgi:hypothetical protein
MADEDLGSLGGGLQDPEMEPTQPASKAPTFAPVNPQPCNQATMMCLRGPCVHLWRLVLRFDSAVKDVMHERNLTCTASGEEFALEDRLVYFCDRWWPRATYRDDTLPDEVPVVCGLALDPSLMEMPEEFRGASRPELHKSWEACLHEDGYDFAWRDFDPEANPDDAPDRRADCAPGTLETVEEAEAREAAEALPPAGSIPEDDDA